MSISISQVSDGPNNPSLIQNKKAVSEELFAQMLDTALVQHSIPARQEVAVRQGDTLSEIVEAYISQQGVSVSARDIYQGVQAVAAANGIQNPNLIFPEQHIDLSVLMKETAVKEASVTPPLVLEPAMMESRAGRQAELTLPVDAPVSSRYGMRFHPIYHEMRLHKGMDLAAPTGTPVRSAAEGTVESTGWREGYGRTVTINHGNGRSTLYAHLNDYQVQAGQIIKSGEVLGSVGSTGNATGPHLHFEVRQDGKPVNPERLLKPESNLAANGGKSVNAG